jgi:signal transduction histidine kinase
MQTAVIPIDEELRLKDLLSYDILDSSNESDYDELLQLTTHICDCHSATITFVDKERQWFKSRINVPHAEGPRDISFCAHTILQEKIMVVNNAKEDKRFYDNPDVTGGLEIAFYAGAPIISSKGYKLGTVCVIDRKPKAELTAQQKAALKVIANQVSKLLELRLKNKQIIENTEALVIAEKKIAQLNMQAEEDEKSHIATELHENFAQTLAAVNMYLGFAETAGDLAEHFIQKSKESITFMIQELKALSKTLIPTTFHNANYLGFIEDHAREFCKTNNIHLYFKHGEDVTGCDHDTGLTLFRIVQSQLKIAKSNKADCITIEIEKNKNLSLSIIDDGENMETPDTERKLLLKNIVTRTEMINGKIKMGVDEGGNNILRVDIPVHVLQR